MKIPVSDGRKFNSEVADWQMQVGVQDNCQCQDFVALLWQPWRFWRGFWNLRGLVCVFVFFRKVFADPDLRV